LVLSRVFNWLSRSDSELPKEAAQPSAEVTQGSIGIIAGNGTFPIRFAKNAKSAGYRVVAVCHSNETLPEIEQCVDSATWIKVGQLGKIVDTFKHEQVSQVAMVGGISRVRAFRDVSLDARGALLLAKLRTAKDDTIMRGIADELEREGVKVVESTLFCQDALVEKGVLTKRAPSVDELNDIAVGVEAIKAMSDQHIGQLVVVKDGVVVAVEAVEGSDAAILRGGELGGAGTVVVKYAKLNQDMRFDVPVAGLKTIEGMRSVGARVLALETGRCLLLDREELIELANKYQISIIGCDPLRPAKPFVDQAEEAVENEI
jgi:hypothetical protein